MLEALRGAIGQHRRIRIDANQSWSLPEAERRIRDWHARFDLDFVEAPVPIDPADNMTILRRRVAVPLCVNEGLWGEAVALRLILARAGDYLCFSSSYVGSMRRFLWLCRIAHATGQSVCKHTWGELGLTAAAAQHALLAAPGTCLGHQQTAQYLADDIVRPQSPIADRPTWGPIDQPGLGVTVDEDKLQQYHEAYRRHGEFARRSPEMPRIRV
jgi:L-alanine-DL-glutamate epimerase-like enolase superfamily enzyme